MTNRLAKKPQACLEGCLLVAAPDWQNEVFARTVCLVIHHRPERAVGIVLNRGLDDQSSGLWEQLAGATSQYREGVLHFGGPHSGPVVALHNCEKYAEFTTAEGVYLASQIQNLKGLMRRTTGDCVVKIMAGQADWEAGQLDEEFHAGKWLPVQVSSKLVFSDEHQMWETALREIGNQYVASIIRCKYPPSNALAN